MKQIQMSRRDRVIHPPGALRPLRNIVCSGRERILGLRAWSATQRMLLAQMLCAWKLCLRKAHKNVAVAAVARKLAVSIWYCLRGLFQPLSQADASLQLKIGRIATAMGKKTITLLGFESNAAFIKRKIEILTAPA